MDDVRKIMGETAQIRHTLEPPMKYVLCKASSLADLITKIRVLENLQGVESVTISLNREMLVSTDLRHSLIREEMRKLERNQMKYAAPIEITQKELELSHYFPSPIFHFELVWKHK
jgi:hypothetical protein